MIYQQSNQQEEHDIFGNDGLSTNIRDFLHSISDRVYLKGFDKYRADLDVKDDLHGEFSYHTEHENREIMFNIAPLIPSNKASGQFIERKGLVGNAFVCIVFQELGAVFKPELISGRVTQVYITVQPVIIDTSLHYKVRIDEFVSRVCPHRGGI